jgi:hypothetical protein
LGCINYPKCRGARDLPEKFVEFVSPTVVLSKEINEQLPLCARHARVHENFTLLFVTRVLVAGKIAGMNSLSSPPAAESGERWRFLRDVMVFQLKLLLDNLRDFALVPISLVAALIDLVYKGEREGALFYKVLRWGAHSEEVIDVYSAIEHYPAGNFKVNPAYTVDAVIARLEGVVVREYEKGGTAASIKAALDRAIDQLHRETKEKGDRARDVVARAADKLRINVGTLPAEQKEKVEGAIEKDEREGDG